MDTPLHAVVVSKKHLSDHLNGRSPTVKCLSAAHTHNIKSLLSSSYSWLLQMPKNIWDMIQKYFLTLNKAQTYGSDTCATCKNKMSEKLKKQSQKKGKKMIVSIGEIENSCTVSQRLRQLSSLS